MLFSYNWLKQYVPDLPAPLKVEEGIIFHAFEVEGIEQREEDILMEIKVLPDRASDCLCHQGVAREVAAIFDLIFSLPMPESDLALGRFQDLDIKIEDPIACRRYIGERVRGVKVGPSPKWLASALEAIGQRSINNIVDATNYVMFDIGQPMHAFDADKVEGGIVARRAKAGEKMTTLDGKDLVLDKSVLVIADDRGPLALAGIKGGNRAEVDVETKNIILESASFDPVLIRKTSAKLGIRTDASKRFENNLSRETALPAMVKLADILQVVAGGEYLGVVDVYPTKQEEREIIVDVDNIARHLGVEISSGEIKNILKRLGLGVEVQDNRLGLTIPYWRVDLQEEANIIEEVGRVYGYDKIKSELLPQADLSAETSAKAEKRFAIANKLREILVRAGFVEVMGYALTTKGEIELANPLASDKAWLRSDLSDWLVERIKFNLEYVLFDTESVKVFEIGKIFKKGYQEDTHLAIGLGYRKKIKGVDGAKELENIKEIISKELGVEIKGKVVSADLQNIIEINLDEIIDKVKDFPPADLSAYMSDAFNYQPVSSYPRIIRDVAVWVPEATQVEDVGDLIRRSMGSLCVAGPILFDEFAKEGRKSLAFRLVFQSYEKTLSDDEANAEMNRVIEALENKGFEVRK